MSANQKFYQDSLWEERYKELVNYKNINGTIDLSYDKVNSMQASERHLFHWICKQKTKKVLNKLEDWKYRKLVSAGIDFSSRNDKLWEKKFIEFVNYKNIHGTVYISNKPGDNIPDWERNLYYWARRQRKQKRLNKLEGWKYRKLLSIGFDFTNDNKKPDDKSFLVHFNELIKFKEKYGHTKVPRQCEEYPQLGRWVDRMKYYPPKGNRRELLDGIGFNWSKPRAAISRDAKAKWFEYYSALVDFKNKFGHLKVSSIQKEYESLYKWTCRMRSARATGKGWKLTETHIKLLDAIGFEWRPKEGNWETNFKKLVAYKEKYGHCYVDSVETKYDALRRWIRKQRKNQDQLTKEQIERLDSIGFAWNSSLARYKREMMELGFSYKK